MDERTRRGARGALSPGKRELLARLLAKKGIELPGEKTIPPRPPGTPARLSFAQEAVWFLDQLEPNQALHNVPCAVRLTGRLVPDALERALGEIVRRHETLRTRFEVRDGTPFQEVSPPGAFRLALTDLAGLEREAAEAEARRLATEEAHRVFDLERGPLFHAFLLRLAEEEHVFVFNFHHTVTDGVSMAVFTRELDALYRAFRAGEPSPLPELEAQFADFAVWQRERLVGERLEEHLDYWRGKLSGDVAVLRLPTDRPRPAVQSFEGGHASVRLGKHLSDALRGLSQRQGVTLGMTLTAAFEVLLHEATGELDMVIGSAVAHRDRRELEGMIAFLVNMVVLRTDLSGDPTLGELLGRVREATLGACAHQELPLSRVLSEVAPERDLSKSPLFQVEFSLLTPDQNPAVYGYGLAGAALETLELPDLTMTPFPVQYENSRYDVAVFLWDMPEGVQGTFEYRKDLFDAGTIERMVERYGKLLALCVERPEARLSGLVERLRQLDQEARASEEAAFQRSMQEKLRTRKRRRSL